MGVVTLATVLTDEPVVADAVASVLDAEVVFEATEAALALPSAPCERSIKPTFGATSAVVVSVSADDVAAVLLEPEEPPPQAARASVAIVQRRVLRIM